MIVVWKKLAELQNRILIPKYYDPSISEEIAALEGTHQLLRLGDLIDQDALEVSTGDEIGKLAYGTGDIPFVRTSDIANWEIKAAPKQGVSEDIYHRYSQAQGVQPGDILLVRDGTYLIGTNCIVTELDARLVYQSHILKLRVLKREYVDPYILFLALNNQLVQRQIRSIQFTADTIDTIGNRYHDVILPIPRDPFLSDELAEEAKENMRRREVGKAFIKQAPFLIEKCLVDGTTASVSEFLALEADELKDALRQDTITDEFGGFEAFWRRPEDILRRVLLPKYYDPSIEGELAKLEEHCDFKTIGELVENNLLSVITGDEIGKMAYGTGDIPFLRTTDFSNWEIKHDPKQGVSEEEFNKYAKQQDVREDDILLVRDGTYLVGSSCIVTSVDSKALVCGGLFKIRSLDYDVINPYLLLGLLNSYIVKRQIRTKQFTRDVIDTLGPRIAEVVLPIPRSEDLKRSLIYVISATVRDRVSARVNITSLASRLTG